MDVTDEDAVDSAVQEPSGIWQRSISSAASRDPDHWRIHELAYSDWKRVLAVHLDEPF